MNKTWNIKIILKILLLRRPKNYKKVKMKNNSELNFFTVRLLALVIDDTVTSKIKPLEEQQSSMIVPIQNCKFWNNLSKKIIVNIVNFINKDEFAPKPKQSCQLGRKIRLEANHYQIKMIPHFTVHQYDVTIRVENSTNELLSTEIGK